MSDDHRSDHYDNINENRYYKRLDRIEQKIDKLSDAMVSIARAEERIVAIEADRQDYWNRLNSHSEKLDILDARINNAHSNAQTAEKLFEQERTNVADSIKSQGARIGSIEKDLSDVVRTTSIINRMFWIAATGILAYAGSQILKIF
jgi:ABC-type transporter Mla subunit MlaD